MYCGCSENFIRKEEQWISSIKKEPTNKKKDFNDNQSAGGIEIRNIYHKFAILNSLMRNNERNNTECS